MSILRHKKVSTFNAWIHFNEQSVIIFKIRVVAVFISLFFPLPIYRSLLVSFVLLVKIEKEIFLNRKYLQNILSIVDCDEKLVNVDEIYSSKWIMYLN